MGRGDRPGFPGLRVATGGGDLIEDIHRQQRRRVFKRAAKFIGLVVLLLLLGIAFKIIKDRRAQGESLETAYEHFIRGTPGELERACTVLELSIDEVAGDHSSTIIAYALARVHLLAEFGRDEALAREAVALLDGVVEGPAGGLARGILAFVDGDLDQAAASLERALEADVDPESWVFGERIWFQAQLVAAQSPDDEVALQTSIAAIEGHLERIPHYVALRRMLAQLQLLAGQTEAALEQLATARDEYGPTHMGLWADQVLYDAYLRQQMAQISSVVEQLLDSERRELMSERDVAHAQLARAVVHVHSAERDEGLERLELAWGGLPAWDRLARRLAIQSALEAGNASRVEAWVGETSLPEHEDDIYRAWAVLVQGDVMEALRQLAELPQKHPWVGYLQALALVEQGRFAEAGPWIERTNTLLPGRYEIEVAQARVELRQGDRPLALRKLEALAQEEAWAPRAWTGLGEAYLQQEGEAKDPDKAQKALERAIEREPRPAEATLLLAELWDGRRGDDPQADLKARALYEQAATLNPYLPRYRERLALYVADLGFEDEALQLMEEVVDEPGVGWPLILELVRLQAHAQASEQFDPEPRLEEAAKRGAPGNAIARLRALIDLRYGDKERVDRAQTALAALVEADPQDVEARVLYSDSLLKHFDRSAAELTVRRGLASVDDDSLDGRLLLAWAQIESRSGNHRLAAPRARRAFLRLLAAKRPPLEIIDAADLATRLWIRVGKERTALSVATQLTDRLGYHSQAWTIRGRTELGAGEAAAAKLSAKRAIELDEHNPRAFEIYGHALLRHGLKDDARDAYQQALELVKGTPLESDYRANLKRL